MLEVDRHIDGYSLTQLLQSEMLTHPIGTLSSRFFSHFFKRVTTKKYHHRSKWGLIPKNPSHRAMNVAMCWTPLGVRCYSSTL